ncbi:MAG: methyltransferase domain-containing protein [Desmonostoc vinosum HA7617-LM4]|jgi:tRNA (mo5U34)-methyltransferase|nr:methyltransferase domain-containing protein [Desmonostoc vinosum HA7617-LM4]
MRSLAEKLTLWLKSRHSLINQKRLNIQHELPLSGFNQHQNEIKFIDCLSDQDLQELNDILQWNCFVIDSHGRRFGNQAGHNKRNTPQIIPDKRILLMNEYFNLADKHVLEIGCFEGIHTIALAKLAQQVTAFDARIENVVKTIVRCSLFGLHPTIFKLNIEEDCQNYQDLLKTDVMHHVGVLYHLKDPVQHLLDLGKYIRQGVMLDTHYALDQDATETYEVNSKKYYYKRSQEGGYNDVFSGMYELAKWLKLDDIVSLLNETGFRKVEIIEHRNERNGPRVLLIASKD